MFENYYGVLDLAEETSFELHVHGQTLELLPQRAVLWQEEGSLWLSDIHLGKAAFFRSSGIAVPEFDTKESLSRLKGLLRQHQPKQVVVTGDLYHTHTLKEAAPLSKLISSSSASFVLVRGNHDAHTSRFYQDLGFQIEEKHWVKPPFFFTHVPNTPVKTDYYVVGGHLHPGVALSGKGKACINLPCFHFTKHYCVLPAFSQFTGLYKIKPLEYDGVYVLANKSVMQVRSLQL